MVIQGDAEMTANVGESGGINSPQPAGKPHGTLKGNAGVRDTGSIAAGTEHPFIEYGIMRYENVHPAKHRLNRRPQFPEGGLGAHILPGDPVNIGKDEMPPGWPDQV
jgi:hypothetical protein